MRSKTSIVNILTTFSLDVVTIMSGLILPQLFISNYGSDAYGITTSITQFLGYLTLLQSGVGGVARASMYEPLATGNFTKLSKIYHSTESFFRKIACITVFYTVILIIGFRISSVQFSFCYTTSMVVIVAFGSFLQYYFGIANQILLFADQKNYVNSIVDICCIFFNVIIIVITVRSGASIHVAKLLGVLVYSVRPIALHIYVKKKYKIDKKQGNDSSLLSQRWDAFGQTVAFFIHKNIDVFLITFFIDYSNVSIYSIYAFINMGLTTFVKAISTATQSAFGDMIAKKEIKTINTNFRAYLALTHFLSSVLFATAFASILPFIRVYTNNFSDASQYLKPAFAVAILIAEYLFCLRLPYHTIIISAGHYRQTKVGAYIEALLNVLVSFVLIRNHGLIGVAIGTLVAMLFRTIAYVTYVSKNLIKVPVSLFTKHMYINVFSFLVALPPFMLLFNWQPKSYSQWVVFTSSTMIIISIFSFVVNYIVFKSDVLYVFDLLKRITPRRFFSKHQSEGHRRL